MIGIIIVFYFLFIIWAYLMSIGKLDYIDKKVYNKMNISNGRTTFFRLITNLASTKFFIVLCILLVLIFRDKITLLISFIMIMDSILIFILKHLFKRERPNVKRLVREKGYSFPSGHTLCAITFYGFLILLISNSILILPIKIILILVLLSLIYLIGYSRIFLGVHYFSDVIGALLLGFSYILLIVYLVSRYENIFFLLNL